MIVWVCIIVLSLSVIGLAYLNSRRITALEREQFVQGMEELGWRRDDLEA